MNVDDEAERLARAHPDYGHPQSQQYALAPYDPTHRAPTRPKPKFTELRVDAEIERRVQQDLDILDAELEGKPVWVINGRPIIARDGVVTFYFDEYKDIDPADMRTSMKMTRLIGNGGWLHNFKTPNVIGVDYASRAPGPGRPRKPKTYVAPGRRAGMTWIARNKQSQEAKRK